MWRSSPSAPWPSSRAPEGGQQGRGGGRGRRGCAVLGWWCAGCGCGTGEGGGRREGRRGRAADGPHAPPTHPRAAPHPRPAPHPHTTPTPTHHVQAQVAAGDDDGVCGVHQGAEVEEALPRLALGDDLRRRRAGGQARRVGGWDGWPGRGGGGGAGPGRHARGRHQRGRREAEATEGAAGAVVPAGAVQVRAMMRHRGPRSPWCGLRGWRRGSRGTRARRRRSGSRTGSQSPPRTRCGRGAGRGRGPGSGPGAGGGRVLGGRQRGGRGEHTEACAQWEARGAPLTCTARRWPACQSRSAPAGRSAGCSGSLRTAQGGSGRGRVGAQRAYAKHQRGAGATPARRGSGHAMPPHTSHTHTHTHTHHHHRRHQPSQPHLPTAPGGTP